LVFGIDYPPSAAGKKLVLEEFVTQAVKRHIQLEDQQECLRLFGEKDHTLKLLRDSFAVTLVARGTEIILSGAPLEVSHASQVIERLRSRLKKGPEGYMPAGAVQRIIDEAKGRVSPTTDDVPTGEILLVSAHKKPISARTENQQKYVDAIRNNDIVIGIGPAGTGKTYLAMAMAVAALRNGDVERLILTRPAVEAGEKLGFLPGDMQDKVDPYLRPLYDALYDMVEYEKLQRLFQHRTVEVAPLAYMRGRTLSNAFIILDEAQNTSPEQIKMFLTRMGTGSRIVVTGDVTQIDLPEGKVSGLILIREILARVKGIEFVTFTPRDVVRHYLVQRILEAYQVYDEKPREKPSAKNEPRTAE
jgi:phosphate starvation-inducible protein PhoH and related proteins